MRRSVQCAEGYQEVGQLVRMPEVQIPNARIFPELERKEEIKNEVDLKGRMLMDTIEKEFLVFANPQSFKFNFPDSMFPIPQKDPPTINYTKHLNLEDQDTFGASLSPEQLTQILQTGEFQVRSKVPTLPYRWKLSSWIIRSKKTIIQTWNKNFLKAYRLFRTGRQALLTQFPQQIVHIIKVPYRLYSLLFGKKKIESAYQFDAESELRAGFAQHLYDKYLKNCSWCAPLWQATYVKLYPELSIDLRQPKNQEERKAIREEIERKRTEISEQEKIYNEIKKGLEDCEKPFQTRWYKTKASIYKEFMEKLPREKLSSSKEMEQQRLLDEKSQREILKQNEEDGWRKEKFTMYLQSVKEELIKAKPALAESVVAALIFFEIISTKQATLIKAKERARCRLRNKISKDYPIRSKCEDFMEEELSRQYGPVERGLEEANHRDFEKDAAMWATATPVHKNIYQEYKRYEAGYAVALVEKKKEGNNVYIPSRVFRTTYLLKPPYPARVVNGQHYIDKKKELTIDTAHHFWKFSLYWMRLKSWTINCFMFLWGQALVGPIGLFCLLRCSPFEYDYDVNNETGTKIPKIRKPLVAVFGTVIAGIKKSRDHFEGLPDRGLFGKSCSRICNVLECYLFRLIIVGILGVIILYPIVIVLNVILTFVLVLTVWLWVPLAMILTYIFNIVVFQFQSAWRPNGCFVRLAPLPVLLFTIVFRLIYALGLLLFAVVICPISIILFSLLQVLLRGLRNLSDCFMICVVRCCGRTPGRDTKIAWKVGGPGMSRDIFNSIREHDVYALVQAHLETKRLEVYREIVQRNASKYTTKVSTLKAWLLKPFNSSSSGDSSIVAQNHRLLMQNFEKQYRNQCRRYPPKPGRVRFTEEELSSYLQNSEKIVHNFIVKQKGAWLFKRYDLEPGMFGQLNRKIWVEIFNCGEEIFEPLEKIDHRVSLEDEADEDMEKNINSVVQALEGEIDLKKNIKRVSAFRPRATIPDPSITMINSLYSLIEQQKGQRLAVSIPEIFIPHLNTEAVLKLQKLRYESIIRNNPRHLLIRAT